MGKQESLSQARRKERTTPQAVSNLHMLGLSSACEHTHPHFPFLKERAVHLTVLMETVQGRDQIAPEGFAFLFSFAVTGHGTQGLGHTWRASTSELHHPLLGFLSV